MTESQIAHVNVLIKTVEIAQSRGVLHLPEAAEAMDAIKSLADDIKAEKESKTPEAVKKAIRSVK